MIRGKKYNPRRYWKKAVIVLFGAFITPAPLLFAFYLGFWVAWYGKNFRIIRAPKKKVEETQA